MSTKVDATQSGGAEELKTGPVRYKLSVMDWAIIAVIVIVLALVLVGRPYQMARGLNESRTFYRVAQDAQALKTGSVYPAGDLREKLVEMHSMSGDSSLYPQLTVRRSASGTGVDLSVADASHDTCEQLVADGPDDAFPGVLTVNDQVVNYQTSDGRERGKKACWFFKVNTVQLSLPL